MGLELLGMDQTSIDRECDGKLAQPRANQKNYPNEFIPKAACTVSSTNPALPALSSVNPRNAPVIPLDRTPPLSSQVNERSAGVVSRGSFELLGMDHASIEQAEETPFDKSLDSALNDNQITTEQNPVVQETKYSQRPFVSILNIIRLPVEQKTVEPNPMAQNTNDLLPPPIPIGELPYGILAPAFANKAQLNQSGDPTMSSCTVKTLMVVNEDALLHSPLLPMLNEDPENVRTKPLISEEENQETQLDYNQNVSIIEVPLITDPNSTPELVKFRPGVYEGDAIPPVYSDFSIVAVDEDYMPQIPAVVQPDMSIIPEPFYEKQVLTESETTNTFEQLIESDDGNNIFVDNQEHSLAVNNAQIFGQPISTNSSRLTGFSESRIVDAKLMVTLRNTRLILIYKGYHFRRYYCQGLKIRWQCVDQKCSAYLYSYKNKVTVVYSVHDHLEIIRQNYSPEKPTKSKAVYSLEEAINTMVDLGPVKDQNADSSVSEVSNIETITLSYTNETATQTSPPPKENTLISQPTAVFCSGNTKIYHDASLDITVKNSSDIPEKDNTTSHAMFSGTENTVTSLPDPLDYCVTSYEPTFPQNNTTSGSSHQVLNSSYNDMLVPKDVKAKVTLTSIPRLSKPQVYYDGKLARPRANQKNYSNEFIPKAACTVSSTNPALPALSSVNPRNAPFIPIMDRTPPLSSQVNERSAGVVSRGSMSLFGVTTPLKVLKTYVRSCSVLKN